LREENLVQHEQLKQLLKENQALEANLVDAKFNWANLEMENDELTFKIQRKNEQLKIFSSQVTTLEIELVKAKQDLGEALNAVYEYEQTAADKELLEQMESNMTFKEGSTFLGVGGGRNGSLESLENLSSSSHGRGAKEDGGSGGTAKKEKKGSGGKIKSFFSKSKKNSGTSQNNT
jgi:hypothetical protein